VSNKVNCTTVRTLRIAHSSHGKFHHQDLARQLYRLGVLDTFFTGYPRFKLKTLGVPKDRVRTFPSLEVPYHAGLRYGLLKGRLKLEMEWQKHERFDRVVARNMPIVDAYIGLSCASLYAGQAVQRRGGLYLCDRGSSHILTQDALLAEEYDRQGIHYRSIDPRILEKEQREYATANAILVPSEFARRTFIAEGVPKTKLHKVPYGVDLDRFGPVGAPESKTFEVLFVGNASPRKGVPDLLKAYTAVSHPHKQLRFVGAVSDELRPILLSAQKSDNSIEILGPWPQAKLPEIMSRSHVLVLPSIEEGLALVQAQALACACPVIATSNTGAEDLFTDGVEGFIVPIRSPDILADRLQYLADNPEQRLQMSEAALQRVQRIGGWDQYGENIVAAVKELLDARK
jgi:Glycosyltransferase